MNKENYGVKESNGTDSLQMVRGEKLQQGGNWMHKHRFILEGLGDPRWNQSLGK